MTTQEHDDLMRETMIRETEAGVAQLLAVDEHDSSPLAYVGANPPNQDRASA